MTADFFRKQKTQMYFAELRVVREVAGSYYMLGLDFLRKLQLFRRKKNQRKTQCGSKCELNKPDLKKNYVSPIREYSSKKDLLKIENPYPCDMHCEKQKVGTFSTN